MNITIVQGAFLPIPPVAGGAVEKLWFDLGREFAKRGLAVTHISREWPAVSSHHEIDGVRHRRVAGFDYPASRLLAKLMDLIYSVRCYFAVTRSDVIITNTFFLPVLLTLFNRKGVVYVSVHRYPQGQMSLYRRADRLQCVSTVVADAVRAQSPRVSSLVKVIPNYVASLIAEDLARSSWAGRRREVLFVGRVHPEKGIDLLIQAFAWITAETREGWTLRIVGPHQTSAGGGGEPFLESLRQSAERLGVPIEWTGPIYDRDALAQAYARARIFVYPSIAAKGEAFPLAPLEAMSQGCPVLTSNLGCFNDYVDRGVNAETFELDNPEPDRQLALALEALMQDELKLQSFSMAGLKTAERFTLKRVADAFIEDFRILGAA